VIDIPLMDKKLDAGNMEMKMRIYFPKNAFTNDHDESIKELISSNINSGLKSARQTFIKLFMPQFEISADIELTKVMKELGISDIFNENKADFTPILGNQKAKVTEIRHSARIKLDKNGVEGSAATAVSVNRCSID
jgi:serine protease inhibitor